DSDGHTDCNSDGHTDCNSNGHTDCKSDPLPDWARPINIKGEH
ncbi:exported nucleotide-binding partial, partial [Nannochloropsis oceanica]